MTIQHEVAGHQNVISFLAFSPDGERILSSSWDGTAKLWNVKDGTLLHDFTWGAPQIEAIAWTPDGKKIILAGSPPPRVLTEQELAARQAGKIPKREESYKEFPKGEIRIYDATDFDLISSFSLEARDIAVSRDGNRLIVVKFEQVILFDLDAGKVIAQFELDGDKWFESVFVSTKDDTIICVEQSSVWFFESSSLKLKRISTDEGLLDEFRAYINELDECGVALDSGSDWRLRSKLDWLPSFWSAIRDEQFLTITTQCLANERVVHMCTSGDGQRIAITKIRSWETGPESGCGVTILAADSGESEAFFESPEDLWLRVSTFSPNGDLLASAGDGQTIYVWNIQSGEMISIGEPPPSIDHVVAHSEINQAAFGGTDGRVGIIDVLSRQVIAVSEPRPSSVVHLEFFPDLKSLIAIWADGVIRILDRFNMTVDQEVTFPKEHFVGGMILNDGQHFIGFGFNKYASRPPEKQLDSELVVLSLTTGEQIDSLPWLSDSDIGSVAASPNRQSIAITNKVASACVWIARYDEGFIVEEIWTKPDRWLGLAKFCPSGQRLLLAIQDSRMSTLELGSINKTKALDKIKINRARASNEFSGGRPHATSFAFSSDEKWLLRSSAYFEYLEMYDLDTLELKKLIRGHQNRVNSLQVWQDRIIISGSSDGTVKFWNIESGELIDSVLPVQINRK